MEVVYFGKGVTVCFLKGTNINYANLCPLTVFVCDVIQQQLEILYSFLFLKQYGEIPF